MNESTIIIGMAKEVGYVTALNDFWEQLLLEEKKGNIINHEIAYEVFRRLTIQKHD